MLSALETALLTVEAAEAKKAFDILVLDLRGLTYIADYFVICSGSSTTQVGAVSDWIDNSLEQAGRRPIHVEGASEANWVLMDYGDVVVHVFDEQTRAYYGLERLWRDAPKVPLREKAGTAPA